MPNNEAEKSKLTPAFMKSSSRGPGKVPSTPEEKADAEEELEFVEDLIDTHDDRSGFRDD